MNPDFSILVLTFNEELHLGKLLQSVNELNASIFILDSGSTDATLDIAANYGAVVQQHSFENHPKQWHHALTAFKIGTPWVICLDADQTISAELKALLLNFKAESYAGINGIYFNRKYIFKGRWIKHGGYYPFYMLKMFRYGAGFSDLNENMDHRFVVDGATTIWKNGLIVEENLKENEISFWINKHNRYSDLVAHEEVERLNNIRTQTLKPHFWGSPDERTAWLKNKWWKMPLYLRPFFYFTYRFIFRLGFMDGRTGAMFHFMQAFWFRLVVDIKISELKNQQQKMNDK